MASLKSSLFSSSSCVNSTRQRETQRCRTVGKPLVFVFSSALRLGWLLLQSHSAAAEIIASWMNKEREWRRCFITHSGTQTEASHQLKATCKRQCAHLPKSCPASWLDSPVCVTGSRLLDGAAVCFLWGWGFFFSWKRQADSIRWSSRSCLYF